MRVCYKCGTEDTTGYIAKRIERGAERLCQSCSARPAKHIQTQHGRCKPHHGDFDENDNPLDDDGEYLLPGDRICKARDCVEPRHIARKTPSTAEILARLRADTTGLCANPDELLLALQEAEGWNRGNGSDTRTDHRGTTQDPRGTE